MSEIQRFGQVLRGVRRCFIAKWVRRRLDIGIDAVGARAIAVSWPDLVPALLGEATTMEINEWCYPWPAETRRQRKNRARAVCLAARRMAVVAGRCKISRNCRQMTPKFPDHPRIDRFPNLLRVSLAGGAMAGAEINFSRGPPGRMSLLPHFWQRISSCLGFLSRLAAGPVG
jgi:hypothetical protein